MQQLRCINCGYQWLHSPNTDPCFKDFRIHVPTGKILAATALLVVGLSLSEIEASLGIKSETIRAHIERLLRDGWWSYLEAILKDRYGVPVDYLVNLGMGVETWLKWKTDSISLFRHWGQRIRRGISLDRKPARRAIKKILRDVAKSLE